MKSSISTVLILVLVTTAMVMITDVTAKDVKKIPGAGSAAGTFQKINNPNFRGMFGDAKSLKKPPGKR